MKVEQTHDHQPDKCKIDELAKEKVELPEKDEYVSTEVELEKEKDDDQEAHEEIEENVKDIVEKKEDTVTEHRGFDGRSEEVSFVGNTCGNEKEQVQGVESVTDENEDQEVVGETDVELVEKEEHEKLEKELTKAKPELEIEEWNVGESDKPLEVTEQLETDFVSEIENQDTKDKEEDKQPEKCLDGTLVDECEFPAVTTSSVSKGFDCGLEHGMVDEGGKIVPVEDETNPGTDNMNEHQDFANVGDKASQEEDKSEDCERGKKIGSERNQHMAYRENGKGKLNKADSIEELCKNTLGKNLLGKDLNKSYAKPFASEVENATSSCKLSEEKQMATKKGNSKFQKPDNASCRETLEGDFKSKKRDRTFGGSTFQKCKSFCSNMAAPNLPDWCDGPCKLHV